MHALRQIAFAALLLLGLAAGCGGKHSTVDSTVREPTVTATPPPETQTGTTTAPTPQQLTQVRVYFVRDGKVAPVGRAVQSTRAIARAAVAALLAGPSAAERSEGLTTALPNGTPAPDITIADGVATVRLSPELNAVARAQLVYTLTQFATISSVHIGAAPPAARSTYEDETPPILVESPLPGQTVKSPLRFTGTANTFEATFQADVVDASGNVLATKTVTATSGSGDRGTFDDTIAYGGSTGAGKLVVYEISAKDSSRINQVEIPLRLG